MRGRNINDTFDDEKMKGDKALIAPALRCAAVAELVELEVEPLEPRGDAERTLYPFTAPPLSIK